MSLSQKSSVELESENKEIFESSEVHSFLGMSGRKLEISVSLMCGVGFLLFGYDQGVMSSLLTLESFRDTFKDIRSEVNATLQGAVIALYEIGCMFGALSTIYFGDKLGRLKIIFTGAIIMLVGGVLQSCAYTVAHLTVARIVSGVGNGLITSTVPVWQAETAPANMRGKLITIQGALITLGIMISYWIDFAFYFLSGDVTWRFPVAFQCIFPLIILPFILKLPESPRWLMKMQREDEAKIVFSALYGLPENDSIIKEQIYEIREALEVETNITGGSLNFKVLVTQGPKRNFHRVCLASCCQWMQQISGINLITYYAGTIFESYLHMDPTKSRILAACNGTEYFLASLIPIFLIERVGRRKLFLFGTTGQFLTMLFLTVTGYLSEKQGNTGASIGAAVLLYMFNTFFAIGMLSLCWLYSPEIASIEIRAPTSALSTASNWISNFLIVMITPVAFENIGFYTFSIFTVINFLMVPVIYFLFPETAGRTLEEVDKIFEQTPISEPWKVVQIARDMPFMHQGDYKISSVDKEKLEPSTSHIEFLKD